MSLIALDMPPVAVRQAPWGAIASIGLHIGVALAILFISPARQLLAPQPQAVSVEIVTPAQYAALQPEPPAIPSPAVPAPAATPQTAAPADKPPERLAPSAPHGPLPATRPTVTAKQLYAAAMLKEPSMRGIRQTMATLASSEKLVQLCNIEGLEQIRANAPSLDPDTLVPYAMADMATDGLTLTATGGAFRSHRKWYGVSFRCTASADLAGVTAFAFELGDPIPADQWDAHNLNAADDDE